MPKRLTSPELKKVTSWLMRELRKERIPWIKPWANLSVRIGGESFPINGWPSNIRSPRDYYGPLNKFFLMSQMLERVVDYKSDLWITPQSIKNLGIEIPNEEPYQIISITASYALMFRNVFHVEQVDDCEKAIGFSFVDYDTEYEYFYERSRKALEALRQRHWMDIREGQGYAAFHPVTDFVSMPGIGQFTKKHGKEGEAHYWATMWHEIIHWTGHGSRLDRVLAGRREREAYALEELVAEIGSAYLCAHFGIEGKLQHAGYLQSWLEVLEDKGEAALAEAFVSAQKAANWVLQESRSRRRRADEGQSGNVWDTPY